MKVVDIEKILVLDNEFEAKLMEDILNEEEIPFTIQSYVNGPYDGIWQNQKGWGHIEADKKYKEEIFSLYEEMKNNLKEEDK